MNASTGVTKTMTGTIALGVDPGRTGAAVLVRLRESAPHEAIAAWTWAPSKAKGGGYNLRTESGERARVESLHDVGAAIAATARSLVPDGCPVALEGLYVAPKSRVPPAAILTLGEAAGEVVGPLRGTMRGSLMRPLYTQWVARVMPPAHGKPSRVAKAYILANTERVVSGLGAITNVEHCCDAACIAYWAAVKSWQEVEG